MSFRILGTGSYVPPRAVTNDDLAQLVETSDEWIKQRVGIDQRHVCTTETTGEMAYYAAKKALEDANVKPEELDLIICATVSNDMQCPTAAGYTQMKLGAKCPAFDINSACSGFIFALETAAAYFAKGGCEKILVVGAEMMSRIIDWTDRNTCVIFGDGAGAAILGKGDGFLASKISTYGGDDVIDIPNTIGKSPFYEGEERHNFVHMKGQETFKFAVGAMTRDVTEVIEKAGLTTDEVDWIVPHQANIRIIQFAAKKLKMPPEKFFVNIEKYGNTSAASVPMALDELRRSGRLHENDIMVLTAFGGGLSSAACVIRA